LCTRETRESRRGVDPTSGELPADTVQQFMHACQKLARLVESAGPSTDGIRPVATSIHWQEHPAQPRSEPCGPAGRIPGVSPHLGDWLLGCLSLLLTAQSMYSTALMLYVWEDRRKAEGNRAPRTFETPQQRFTILLPARHEEDVIQDTIQRVVDLRYPRGLSTTWSRLPAGRSWRQATGTPRRTW
jgi:hypothetical protein